MARLSTFFVIFFAAVLGVQHVKAQMFVTETTVITIGFLMQDVLSEIDKAVPIENQYLTNAITAAGDGVMRLISELYLIVVIEPETLPTDIRFSNLLNDLFGLYTIMAAYAEFRPDALALALAAGNLGYGINLLVSLQVPFHDEPSIFTPLSEDEAYVDALIVISRGFSTLATIEPTITDFLDVMRAMKVAIKYASDPGSITTQEGGEPTIQTTFVLVKSDGVARNLTGTIITRLNDIGLQMNGMKLVWMTQATLDMYMDFSTPFPFYAEMALLGPGPGVVMVWQGFGAVNAVRDLIGSDDPNVVVAGTIRGDFGITQEKDIVHSSLTEMDAQQEISMWFNANEMITWNPADFL